MHRNRSHVDEMSGKNDIDRIIRDMKKGITKWIQS